jgi:hypothetical protein
VDGSAQEKSLKLSGKQEVENQMRDGRGESRIPVGSLGQLELLGNPRDSECAQFQNISDHGARLVSRRPWQSGDHLLITFRCLPFCSTAANVVYCQPLRDGLYAIGCRSTNGGILRLLEKRVAFRFKGTQAAEHSADSLDFAHTVHSKS